MEFLPRLNCKSVVFQCKELNRIYSGEFKIQKSSQEMADRCLPTSLQSDTVLHCEPILSFYPSLNSQSTSNRKVRKPNQQILLRSWTAGRIPLKYDLSSRIKLSAIQFSPEPPRDSAAGNLCTEFIHNAKFFAVSSIPPAPPPNITHK